jgi:DNA transformation protein
MAVTPGFVDFVVERLSATIPVEPRRMFGGVLLYGPAGPVALLADDRLYLKSDDVSRERFDGAGMEAFSPYGDGRTMPYREVPGELLEDADALAPWVRLAAEAAERSVTPGRRR